MRRALNDYTVRHKAGYLFLKGSKSAFTRKSWKLRYFILDGKQLSYLKSEGDVSRTSINLEDITTVALNHKIKSKQTTNHYYFDVHTILKVYSISASGYDDAHDWVNAIQANIELLQCPDKRMSGSPRYVVKKQTVQKAQTQLIRPHKSEQQTPSLSLSTAASCSSISNSNPEPLRAAKSTSGHRRVRSIAETSNDSIDSLELVSPVLPAPEAAVSRLNEVQYKIAEAKRRIETLRHRIGVEEEEEKDQSEGPSIKEGSPSSLSSSSSSASVMGNAGPSASSPSPRSRNLRKTSNIELRLQLLQQYSSQKDLEIEKHTLELHTSEMGSPSPRRRKSSFDSLSSSPSTNSPLASLVPSTFLTPRSNSSLQLPTLLSPPSSCCSSADSSACTSPTSSGATSPQFPQYTSEREGVTLRSKGKLHVDSFFDIPVVLASHAGLDEISENEEEYDEGDVESQFTLYEPKVSS